MHFLDRRNLLKGFALGSGAGLLTPVLTRLISSAHGAEPNKNRLMMLVGGNGWGHNGGGSSRVLDSTIRPDRSYDLPASLAPLKAMQSKVSILRTFSNPYGQNLHGSGWGTLTMVPPVSGKPGGISIDRLIAKQVGKDDAFDQVHVGLAIFGKKAITTCSADGPGAPFPALGTPVRAYQTYFGGVMAKAPGEVNATLAQDKSLLDAACGDIQRAAGRLAGAERQKLDQLLGSCRALEQKIVKRAVVSAAGGGPVPPPPELDRSGLNADVIRGHCDIIANAFAFGITHVGYLSILGHNDFNDSWGKFGIPGDAHENYSHNKIEGWGREQYDEGMLKIAQFKAGELAYIFEKLRQFPEGAGTIADSTLAMWVNSGGGKHHNGYNDHAAVLVGDLRGTVKTGKFVQYPGRTHTLSDLFVTVAQFMGVKIEKFGDPSQNKGPLTEIM